MIVNEAEIKEKVGIIDVLAHLGYKVNSQKKCACPVHGGKDNNFTVKNDIGICWSQCGGKSWDAVGLIMEIENINYAEGLKRLAEIGNIKIEYKSSEKIGAFYAQATAERTEKDKLLALMKATAHFYFMNCWSGVSLDFAKTLNYQLTEHEDTARKKPTMVYLDSQSRPYSYETLKKFGVFATPEKDILGVWAAQNNHAHADMLQLGLRSQKEISLWDTFKNRLVFPIFDDRGSVIGFGGRKLNADQNPKNPKYINSSESPIYEKKGVLYGLHQTKRAIKESGYAYLVEGYTDVLTMFDRGVQNAVGSCGTAFTDAQARILKRYTEKVIILFDGDEAGQKAASLATAVLTSVGLSCDVVFLNKDQDPDSFLREFSTAAFEAMVQETKKDAVLWLSLLEYSETDMFQKEKALGRSAELLALMPSEARRTDYIDLICKKSKINKKILTEAVNERLGQKLDRKGKKSELSQEQKNDVEDYGLYVHNHQYFATGDIGTTGWAFTNFTIRPIMLIIGADRSWRLVEIKNKFGRSFVTDIDSDSFVEIAAFKKEIERRGNFLYFGKPELFTRIKAKLYKETTECYPIHTLGWHSAGFWVWGNGISVNGEFRKVNEYGIVQHEDENYFLPAFAKVQTANDDEENKYEDEKAFVMESGACISFSEWCRRMVEVHLDNGMMGIAYYCASMFRDIIYTKFNYFPHLNLFGPPGAGKSYFAWSIQYMYGRPKQPFHLVQGTNVGFFRRLAKVRNGISWFDEYSNDVDFKRVEALKAAYDGVGHEKGDKDNANATVITKVKSALIISGQQQPTQDVALFKRCISLNFPTFQKSDERDKIANDLRNIEQQYRLPQITQMLQKYRSEIANAFSAEFDKVRSDVSPHFEGNKTVEDRILNNHLIPLTVFKILSAHLEFGFDYAKFKAFVIENIVNQSAAISSQNDTATWWKIFNYLAEMNLLQHNIDFIVQDVTKITVLQKNGRDTETKIFSEAEGKRIIFVRFEKSHPLYLEYHKRQHGKGGHPESSLKYMLATAAGFVGDIKAKKFNGLTKKCWAFDMQEIGVDLPLTSFVENDQTPTPPIEPIPTQYRADIKDEDLPF